MKRKHLLVISQYFYPESFRINDMCCEWVKRGYEVTVVTGIPNYPQGKFYKGYRGFKKRKECWNGVNIIRIPLFARGKTAVGLVLNYVSFAISGFFWQCFTKLRADLVFTFEVSPMTQALIGAWYAKRYRVPHFLYVQDLWPENVEYVTGIHNRGLIGAIDKMVDWIYRRSDKIFATSQSFVKEIQKRIPDDADKVVYWPQYAEDFYVPLLKHATSQIPKDDRFKIIFTGNIGQAQGLEILPLTAKLLKEKNMTDVSFYIVGDGRQREHLAANIQTLGVGDMFFMLGQQPAEKVPELLAVCDAAFVSFANHPLFEKTIPAKLQSYMACGMPILASAIGETERIIREAACGVCCEIGNAEALVEGICELQASLRCEMSRNARAYFERNFQKQALMDEMDRYFEREIHA